MKPAKAHLQTNIEYYRYTLLKSLREYFQDLKTNLKKNPYIFSDDINVFEVFKNKSNILYEKCEEVNEFSFLPEDLTSSIFQLKSFFNSPLKNKFLVERFSLVELHQYCKRGLVIIDAEMRQNKSA